MPFCRRVPSLLTPAALAALLVCCGCGNPGQPLAPSLMLPRPVVDLSAVRTGNRVTLRWTNTRETTDRVVLKSDVRASICRAEAAGPCVPIGTVLRQPAAEAEFDDTLSEAAAQGPARLLRYEVHLENRRGRDAGSSNPAWVAAGWAPPAVVGAQARVTPDGIEVEWQTSPAHIAPAAARLAVRLLRTRVLVAGAPAISGAQISSKQISSELKTGSDSPQPVEQELEAPERAPATDGASWQPDHTLDSQALLNLRYRYTVQMVEEFSLGHHQLTVAGSPGETPVLDAKDTFPPATPQGLVAIANPMGNTIDLSWAAGQEPDLAGYFVYRGKYGSAEETVRVSGPKPIPQPSWTDARVLRGVRYAYSVAAVDTSGNVSPRSAETTETLPTQ